MSAYPLVLASASPRRRDLLASVGIAVTILPADIDETALPSEHGVEMALRLCREKAEVASRRVSVPSLVLAADTVVLLEGESLGKPRDEAEARSMLASLSGRVHEVATAFAIRRSDDARLSHVQAVRSSVRFRVLGEAEIAAYVDTGEPMDKAGGYGIQGQGAGLVLAISGSYSNIVGLPLAEVIEALSLLGGPRPFSAGK